MNINFNLVYDIPGFSRKLPWMQDNDDENDQLRRIMREEDRQNFVRGRNDSEMDQIDFDSDLATFLSDRFLEIQERTARVQAKDDLMLELLDWTIGRFLAIIELLAWTIELFFAVCFIWNFIW